MLSLLLIAVSVALAFCGAIFAYVGVQELLAPEDAGNAVAAVLVTVVGLAGVVAAGGLVFWLRPRAVMKLSGRKPPSFGDGSGAYFGGFGGGSDGGGCGGDGGGGGGGSC